MVDLPASRALLLGLAVGVLIGSVGAGAFGTDATGPPSNSDAPPTTVSSSGPSCYDGSNDVEGWLHVVANGETWAVTLDATVVHSPGTRVDVNVSREPTDTYDIALTTTESTRESPRSDAECRVATSVTVGTALVEPDLEVTVNGRTVRSVDQDDTVATLYSLPTPIDATE